MNKTINNQRYVSLIQWLVDARKEQGLTVRQFAERIDVPLRLGVFFIKCLLPTPVDAPFVEIETQEGTVSF